MIPNPTLWGGRGGQAEDQKENNSLRSLTKHSWLFCINALCGGSCLLPQPFKLLTGKRGWVCGGSVGCDLPGEQEENSSTSSFSSFWHSQPGLVGPAQRSLQMPFPQDVNILLSWQNTLPDLLSAHGTGILARSSQVQSCPLGRAANPHFLPWELIPLWSCQSSLL